MDDRIHYLKVNRVEVIDSTGRAFTRYYEEGLGVEVHLQDAGRTLKVFAGTPTQSTERDPSRWVD